MLLRLTVPLLEISSTSPAQLRPQLSSKRIPKQTKRYYRSANVPNIFRSGEQLNLAPPVPDRKDPRLSQRSYNGKKKFLSPYDLSQRVEALCREGNLSQAISSVKEAPLDAQNAIVWATLIRTVIGTGKYQEAYRLFIDMKRRGIRPSSRTFSTLLKGYARISDWKDFPLQLDNVCSVYDQLKQHHAMVQSNGGSEDSDLSNIPYNLLIGIFGKAQRIQRMFDVFNAMPSKGPLAPDIHTFTALITAIGNRQLAAFSNTQANDVDDVDDVDDSGLPTPNELAYKNASDAKLIWKQLLRVCQTPDSHAIRAILKPLSRGRPSDQNFALDIAHEYLGLSRPGDQAIPAKLPLHKQTLEAVLVTCNVARRYRYTLHYVQQVIDSSRFVLLDRKHIDLVMLAHAALACMDPGESAQALETLQWMLLMYSLPKGFQELSGGIGPSIRPETSTYDLVALACWNGGDWTSACRTFEMMTGHSRDEFRGDMLTLSTNRHSQGPSAFFMSSFIRAAAKTNDLENIHQALNILEYYGLDVIQGVPFGHLSQDDLRKQDSNNSKLVEALRMVLPRMLESTDYDQATKTRWKDILPRAEKNTKDLKHHAW